jgi:ARC6-like, IMS domain
VADRSGIVQKLEDKVAAALRDHNLTAAAGGTPAAQSAMAEYDRLAQDPGSSIGIRYLALHSVAMKQGFYIDKRDQQEMLGTVSQEMGNMSPTEVLAGIKHLKSNYPAIYQCDAVAIDRKESSIVEFMARLPIDQQDQAVVKAQNVQLNARPITSGASEAIQPEARENPVVATEPFIQPSQSQPVESPISKKQAYAAQQSKLPRAHSSELDRNKLDFEPTYTKLQTKISEESISIPLKNLWIGVLLLFCLISGVTLGILNIFSSRNTQSYVDQVKVNQENDKRKIIQDGIIASQPISLPTSSSVVLQSKPVVTSGSSIPVDSGNINNSPQSQPKNGSATSVVSDGGKLVNQISQDEAIGVVKEWLAAKNNIFAPPYNQQLGESLTVGKALKDNVRGPSTDGEAESSLEWLRNRGKSWRYGYQRIDAVNNFISDDQQAVIAVAVYEQRALYNSGGGIERSIDKTTSTTYTLRRDGGRLKIADFK